MRVSVNATHEAKLAGMHSVILFVFACAGNCHL